MALMSRLATLGAARRYARNNASQVHGAIDKVARAVKGRAPSRHARTIDKAGSMIKKAATGSTSTAAGAQRQRR